MKRLKNRVFSLLLVAAMSLQATSVVYAEPAETTEPIGTDGGFVWEEVEDDSAQTEVTAQEADMEEAEYEENEDVRVLIVLEDDAVIDEGFSTDGLVENASAMKYAQRIEDKQEQIAQKISAEALDGESLDVRYHFTILANAISATVEYGDIEEIEAVDGVEAVYLTPVYDVLEETADPLTITSGDMVGSYYTWLTGYTGAGTRIAVIDTGIDADHPSFDGGAFDYSLAKVAEKAGTTVSAYDLLDKVEITKALPKLNANSMYEGLTADALFLNDKIAYAFNYVDQNLDVTHDNDSEGDHGTHVAGIACANLYVPSTGAKSGYGKQEIGVVGIAPEAQLLAMKVFGTNGGAYSDDYMAAIEDAILLNADAVNLSLGSSSAGNSRAAEAYINTIFDKLQGTDTVVSISAGNSGAWSDDSTYGANLASDVNLDTVGSPGSYTNALTVASAVNSGYTGYAAVFDDTVKSFYADGSGSAAPAFSSLDTSGNGTEYDYVLMTGTGTEDDFNGIDVNGKIVLVARGAISFYVKQQNAQAAGAIGALIYNNQAGTISMSLSGSTANIPCASITLADAKAIMESATYDEEKGIYTGKMVVSSSVTTNYHAADGYTMSDFSSWGISGALDLKPEITAPGGNIYSTRDDGTYGLMSGTSMAAPSVAGMSALVAQYIKENDLAKKTGLSVRTLSQSLLMSTAIPLTESDGEEYSPRNQGAGLANVEMATTSPAYILMGDKEGNDGKVKAELGDDPEKNGTYSFSFYVHNMSDETQFYTVDSSILTEEALMDGEDKYIIGTSHKLNPKVTVTTSNTMLLYYDLNEDGAVDNSDAKALLAYVNGSAELAVVDQYQDMFDFNSDGVVDSADVHGFLKALKDGDGTVDFSQQVLAVKDTTKVNVSVTLSEADRAYLDSNFENGMYIDGFVYLRGTVDLSVPMVAFYGNWADSSMFEPYDYLTAANGGETYPTYSGIASTNYLTYTYAGDTAKYKYASNMYTADSAYIADRNAFSSEAGDTIGAAYYTLIRNASRVITSVTNAETGEEYFSLTEKNKAAEYYYAGGASWESTINSSTLNWNGTDKSGNPLPEGTKVNITVKAIPAYYDAIDAASVNGKGLCFTVPMTIDNTAPSVDTANVTEPGDHQMTIPVTDNRYVAAVSVYGNDKKTLIKTYSVNQTELGATTNLTIEYPDDVFYVKVKDYAGNSVTFRVNKSGEADTDYTSGITLNQTTASVLKGGSFQLEATVAPVTILNDTVTWTSSDESIASVDENGVVTGVEVGNATITATTVATNGDGEEATTLSATCEVTVETLDIAMNSILWDEDGKVFFAEFNTADLANYNKLSEEQGNRYMSVANVGEKLFAATYGDSQTSDLYLVDPTDNYSATGLVTGNYWCTDMAYSAETGVVYATYGPYLQFLNSSTGERLAVLNLGLNDYFTGIAYAGTATISGYVTDILYAVTRDGMLYQLGMVPAVNDGFNPVTIGSTGVTNAFWYYNSLYYDADSDYLLWNMYDGSNNVTLYALSVGQESVNTYDLGKFPDGVWPVSGLYQATASSEASEEATAVFADAVLADLEVLEEVPVLEETIPELGK